MPTTGPAGPPPATASEDRGDLDGQLAWCDCDIGPEGTNGQPPAGCAAAVASPVPDAGLTPFVTQPPVQLDQDSLFREADVVSFTTIGSGRALPHAERETVWPQDVSHEPHLLFTTGAPGLLTPS